MNNVGINLTITLMGFSQTFNDILISKEDLAFLKENSRTFIWVNLLQKVLLENFNITILVPHNELAQAVVLIVDLA